jgi:hypothetical protein
MGKKFQNEAHSEFKRLKINPVTEPATMLMLPKPPEANSAAPNQGSTESLRVMQAMLASSTEGEPKILSTSEDMAELEDILLIGETSRRQLRKSWRGSTLLEQWRCKIK